MDIRLNDVRARLARFPKKLADSDARVAAAKADLDASKAAQLATVKDRKKYELDVESWKEKVRKYKDQTSQIKTNEAYRALQHEVQMAEDEIAKAEDRLLEQMVASEEYDRRIKASEIALKEVEQVERVQRSNVEADRALAEKELAEGTAERDACRNGNPRENTRSLRSHREETQWRGAGRSAQREMRRVRDDRAPARDPGNAALRQRRSCFTARRARGSSTTSSRAFRPRRPPPRLPRPALPPPRRARAEAAAHARIENFSAGQRASLLRYPSSGTACGSARRQY